jgi:hypothetical protein
MPCQVEFAPHVHHDQHPDLRGRKQIVARLLIARNLRARPTLQSGRRSKPFKDAVKFAEAAVNSDLVDRREPLHAFLREILDEARRHPPKSDSQNEVFDQFENDLSAMCCDKCVVRRLGEVNRDVIERAMCDGNNDVDNMQFGALCWQTFSDLFKFVVQIAEKAYGEILHPDKNEQLKLKLHTRVTTEAGFGARTLFPNDDAPGKRTAIIELTLPVEDFDDGYYLRLPYYMFHEVCVHAPEGWAAADKRQPANERCAFGEGFVDAAAVRILTRALEGGDVPSAPDRPYFERFMNEAEKAQHQRADLDGAQRSSPKQRDKAQQDAADARDRGMRLFKRLAKREDRQSADEAIRIALCVNLLPLAPEERINFMTTLDRASAGQAAVIHKRADWLHSLRDAANRGDLNTIRGLIEPVEDF